MKFITGAALLLAALSLQACKGELYSNLDEREANLMVATLLASGIDADRTVQKNGKLTVSVEEDQFGAAVSILTDAGLPQTEFATIGSVFKKEGLVASPVQERAQMIYALSEELSRTISEIDGVLTARVHVVLPDNDPLQRFAAPASASVFIRHEADLTIDTLIPQIKTLVANGIAGLTYEKVSVVPIAVPKTVHSGLQNLELASVMGAWVHVRSVHQVYWLLGGFSLIASLLGAGLMVLLRSFGAGSLPGLRRLNSSD
nr:type III secretion inner membrane ring lipoprotein SctJ [Ensifer sp. ENS02]